MSKMLEDLRSLRDAVVVPLSECGDKSQAGLRSKGERSRTRKKGRRPSTRADSFTEWMQDVSVEVQDICGMGLEILSGTPWKELYREGTSPRDAAQWALDEAEREDDDDDDGELEEDVLSEADYAKWTTKLNSKLKKKFGTTLEAAKKLAHMTNPALHSIFMSNATVEMAARMIMRATAMESTDEDDEPRPSLRQRSYSTSVRRVVDEDVEEDDVLDPLDSLMEEFRVSAVPRPRVSPENEVMRFMNELNVAGDAPTIVPKPSAAPARARNPEQEFIPPTPVPKRQPAPMSVPSVEESMGVAFQAVQATVAHEQEQKKAWRENQKRQQEADERERERIRKLEAGESQEDNEEGVQPDDGDLDEASVMGGDYGRWAPATSAAGSAGAGLAAAISKATGVKYRFQSEGAARSSDVGSDLSFYIEPEDKKEPVYFMVFKIKGDKENPTWDVALKKGKAIGSATTVASERGLETSGLKSAVGKLKGGLGSKGGE